MNRRQLFGRLTAIAAAVALVPAVKAEAGPPHSGFSGPLTYGYREPLVFESTGTLKTATMTVGHEPLIIRNDGAADITITAGSGPYKFAAPGRVEPESTARFVYDGERWQPVPLTDDTTVAMDRRGTELARMTPDSTVTYSDTLTPGRRQWVDWQFGIGPLTFEAMRADCEALGHVLWWMEAEDGARVFHDDFSMKVGVTCDDPLGVLARVNAWRRSLHAEVPS
jgi:hypothetical protein